MKAKFKALLSNDSPARNLLIMAALIILVEALIMTALPHYDFPHSVEIAVDSAALIMILLPALYVFMFRPMARRIAERERAEAALREAHARLEQRVAERTAELDQRNRESLWLTELSSVFQACGTLEEAYRVIAHFAHQLFPGVTGALFVRSPSRSDLEALANWGNWPRSAHSQVIAAAECWALRRGRAHITADPATGITCCYDVAKTAGHMCIPMSAQGDEVGVLCLQLPPAAHDNPAKMQDLQRIAMAVAEHTALALANLQLRETLRAQSIRDPLTGLFNRRYMEETLERELRRAARDQHPLGVVMLDLDHFKHFNDMFGHEAGDTVLREMGAFLQSRVRGGDVACRYGGEEFTLIMPDAARDAARERAESLRAGIKQLAVQHRGQSVGALSISLGVAIFPEHGTTADALLRLADQALYRAKQEGRDRVIVCGEPAEALGFAERKDKLQWSINSSSSI